MQFPLTTRPRSNTSARWQTFEISSKSVETMRIAAPSLQRDVEQLVDLGFGADVDAGGRVFEHIDLRFQMRASGQPRLSADCRLTAVRSARLGSLGLQADGLAEPARRRALAVRRQPASPRTPRGERVQEQILAHRETRQDRLADAIRADEIDAERPSPARGEAIVTAAPSMRISPPSTGSTPNSARLTTSCPAPRRPDEPDDLAGVDAGVERADVAEAGLREFQPRRALPLGRAPEHLARLASDDQQDRFVGRRLGHDALAGDLAVAQDHHAVGDLEHFVEPVRDIDHADALLAQAAQRGEQARDLVSRQAGGRLVEHQDFGVGRQARARSRRAIFPCATDPGCADPDRYRRRVWRARARRACARQRATSIMPKRRG